jgi:hypothetical protein
MAITDRVRKILWGKSGNRCAVCRQHLVIDETGVDDESVVGDECHIVSGAAGGPRHDVTMDPSRIDDLTNLVLLCRVHHKMVDDQCETYTADVLLSIRKNHERWVESKFSESADTPPVRLKRFKSEIPMVLKIVESGQELFNFAANSHASTQDPGEDLSESEVEMVGSFLQSLSDWSDIANDLEPIDRVRAMKSIGDDIKTLKAPGFLVFAAQERQRLEGGIGVPSDFMVLHISINREGAPEIIRPGQEPSPCGA